HPFYQERGTPIAVDLLVRALSERGDTADVLTFHEGADRHYPGVTIHRIASPPGIRNVGPGPSVKKLICDVFLFASLIRRLRREDYDVIHAVEESAFMAMVLKPFTSVPFVYDMDSTLSTQIIDKYPLLSPLRRMLRFLEAMPVRRAAAVVPVCDALANEIDTYGARRITVLRDVSLMQEHTGAAPCPPLRESLGISGTISMYIGNLEAYQGIDLLLESFARAHLQHKGGHLVIIGGNDKDIARYQAHIARLGMEKYVHFLGQRPVHDLAFYMAQADVLVSPRTHGVNTPMKIYSYLHSGVPVLATDLPTHNQVLDSEIACLAPATVSGFADAWVTLLRDREHARQMGERARAFVEREHSYEAFQAAVNSLYAQLDEQVVHAHSPPARP
ncbi:glycosyltransferase, partial [Aquisalimonas sp.]|uniref:glycosyltransferase n=1 Tax=Aquisalimonas sp. TaxID=1872621 RepID=UPI0025C0071A